MPKVLFRAILARGQRADFDKIIEEVNDEIDNTIKPELIAKHDEEASKAHVDVGFGALKRVTNEGISVFVYPKGDNKDKWRWLTLGTPPHKIPKTPKPPGTSLKFRWGGRGSYKPFTAPFAGPPRLASGGKAETVYFKQVNHPGIEPRYFEKKIADEYKPRFKNLIENAFRRGIRKMKAA